MRDVLIELLSEPEPRIRGGDSLSVLSLDDMAQVQVPLTTDLLGTRGLPVYFLLVVVVVGGGAPITTVSTMTSQFTSETMLTSCLC